MIPTERDDGYTTSASVKVLKDSLMNCSRSTQAAGRHHGKSVLGLTNKVIASVDCYRREGSKWFPLSFIVRRRNVKLLP